MVSGSALTRPCEEQRPGRPYGVCLGRPALLHRARPNQSPRSHAWRADRNENTCLIAPPATRWPALPRAPLWSRSPPRGPPDSWTAPRSSRVRAPRSKANPDRSPRNHPGGGRVRVARLARMAAAPGSAGPAGPRAPAGEPAGGGPVPGAVTEFGGLSPRPLSTESPSAWAVRRARTRRPLVHPGRCPTGWVAQSPGG
jgi:hypothetical protein